MLLHNDKANYTRGFSCCANCKCVNGRLKIHEIAAEVFIFHDVPDNSAAVMILAKIIYAGHYNALSVHSVTEFLADITF
jgi:hypothetical protein